MLIEVSNTLTVENPTPEMVLWCKRNLTIPNPEYAKKSRMNLWLGNTPKVLSLYETRGTTLVLPFGTLRLLPKDISDKALFLSEFAVPVEVNYNADVPLYDYQETAVQAMVAASMGYYRVPPEAVKRRWELPSPQGWDGVHYGSATLSTLLNRVRNEPSSI